jgi:hypothetical protein
MNVSNQAPSFTRSIRIVQIYESELDGSFRAANCFFEEVVANSHNGSARDFQPRLACMDSVTLRGFINARRVLWTFARRALRFDQVARGHAISGGWPGATGLVAIPLLHMPTVAHGNRLPG